jgi:hypothetical protein
MARLHGRRATWASLLLTLVLAQGCGGELLTGPPPSEWLEGSVYLPYLESVEIPSPIRAGAAFTVVLHFSAAAKPEVLGAFSADGSTLINSEGGPRVYNPSEWPDATYDLVCPWVAERSSYGAPVTEVQLRLTAAQPGERILRIQSAATQEQGGILGHFAFPPRSTEQLAPGTEYRDYPYTILPAVDPPAE